MTIGGFGWGATSHLRAPTLSFGKSLSALGDRLPGPPFPLPPPPFLLTTTAALVPSAPNPPCLAVLRLKPAQRESWLPDA